MKYATFTIFTLALCLFSACKSDPKAAEQTDGKQAIDSEIVGQSVKVDPNAADIDISGSTTDVKRYDSPYQQNGCTLVSDQLFEQVFGTKIKEVTVNSIPNKGHCLWTWMKPNWMEIDNANEKKGATYREFKNTMTVQVVNFGIVDAAKQQYVAVAEGKKETFNTKVDGVGEEAVWSAKDHMLVARKAHLMYNLSVEVSENAAENMEKAKALLAGAIK